MTISNLYLKYGYSAALSNMPIVVLINGWDGKASDFLDTTLNRFAANGFFAVAIGMRGRDGASGARDASGREIYDIYDGIQYVTSNFSVSNKIAICGYSGGGGNALAAACKFPDLFASVVDFYGMSDYGRDGTNGWYQNCNNGTYQSNLLSAIGSPISDPNNYYARDATAAITNYTSGHLCIFHDESDTVVPLIHTTRIKNALDGAGLTNYTLNQSNSGSGTRWTHGHAMESGIEFAAEQVWIPLFEAASTWTIPASGTVTVIGYIVTKRFTVWLNSGLDAAATVAYNTATDTYTVTPLTTDPINVTITQGAKTGSATGITEATVITVA